MTDPPDPAGPVGVTDPTRPSASVKDPNPGPVVEPLRPTVPAPANKPNEPDAPDVAELAEVEELARVPDVAELPGVLVPPGLTGGRATNGLLGGAAPSSEPSPTGAVVLRKDEALTMTRAVAPLKPMDRLARLRTGWWFRAPTSPVRTLRWRERLGTGSDISLVGASTDSLTVRRTGAGHCTDSKESITNCSIARTADASCPTS